MPSDVQVSNIIQLETLHLDLNNIESAPAEFFANFPVLKTLHISQNSLSRVPQIHSVAGKLEHLNLGENPIQTAHSSDFVRHGGHSALKTLSWYNPTDFEGTVSFDDDVFFNLDSIETLSLLNLNFWKLPDLSNNIDTLKTLTISGNSKLTHLDPKAFFGDPPDYTKPVSLEQIVMDCNSFRTIPAEFLKALRNAEFLHFGDNGIECFPMSALGTLQFLRGIYFENNLIKTVDDIGH